MNPVASRLFNQVRLFSNLAIIFAILVSVLFQGVINSGDLSWQVVLSVLALAIGIPHGAVDHLITLPRSSKSRFILFIVGYVAIAIVSVIAILHWNVIGFEVVVWMSALHFGFGDASFIAESDRLAGKAMMPKYLEVLYALSAGCLPVIIPLVREKSSSALGKVNSSLVNWAGNYTSTLRYLVLTITLLALVMLATHKRYREIIDLTSLAALALVTPPLIAFAFYFGCWHATRHTARLTLLLPSSIQATQAGDGKKSLIKAINPGLPALIGTVLVGISLAMFNKNGFSSSLLWSLLVVVWALTVPHMMATAKLDLKALSFK
jgi:Brp/Blh family beta-carotene 15,15'-monooxygenase